MVCMAPNSRRGWLRNPKFTRRGCAEVDRHASYHLKSKLDGQINIHGVLPDGGKSCDAISYKWAFQILPDRNMAPDGEQISRIAEQLHNMNVVVKMELNKGLRNQKGYGNGFWSKEPIGAKLVGPLPIGKFGSRLKIVRLSGITTFIRKLNNVS